jgi:hypothetical protein
LSDHYMQFGMLFDVSAYAKARLSRWAKAQSPPEDFEGRIRDFRVVDSDGNKLDFCTRLNS